MVADYRRFGRTPFRHLTLRQFPDGAVSHSSRQHPHSVTEFQSRLVSGQSLQLDISIVICFNLTDVQPAESPVNTANHCFLPRKFAKMLFYRVQSDSFRFKQLLSCYSLPSARSIKIGTTIRQQPTARQVTFDC